MKLLLRLRIIEYYKKMASRTDGPSDGTVRSFGNVISDDVSCVPDKIRSCHSGLSGCIGSEVQQWVTSGGFHSVDLPEVTKMIDEREDQDGTLAKISLILDAVRLFDRYRHRYQYIKMYLLFD